MQSMPMSSWRRTTCASPASITAGSIASPRNSRNGRSSQPGEFGSRPAWVVRIRSELRFTLVDSLGRIELDIGGLDDLAVKPGLGFEPAREFLRAGEIDLHEGRLQPLAYRLVLAD